jgi:hypothetical protein
MLSFDWSYFWSYYNKIEHEVSRAKMREEVLRDDWLFGIPADAQINVLKTAPVDFIESIQGRLKPEVLNVVKPTKLIDWSKL